MRTYQRTDGLYLHDCTAVLQEQFVTWLNLSKCKKCRHIILSHANLNIIICNIHSSLWKQYITDNNLYSFYSNQ